MHIANIYNNNIILFYSTWLHNRTFTINFARMMWEIFENKYHYPPSSENLGHIL